MTISQCDVCGETLDIHKKIVIRQHWQQAELCSTCAQPLGIFFKEHNFLDRFTFDDLQTDEQKVS